MKSQYDTESETALNTLLDRGAAKKQAKEQAEKYAIDNYITKLSSLTSVSPEWQTTFATTSMDEEGKSVQTTFSTLSDA